MSDPHAPELPDMEKDTSTAEESFAERNTADARIDEYKTGWQRAVADYQNLKKEMEDRKTELFRWSEEKILGEFIPIYDNFKKAFSHHPELDATNDAHNKMQNWIMGIGFIKKQFEEVLKSHEVEEIKVEGQYNTEFHDVVAEEESDLEAGSIIREVESGYLMKGKVIKVAKVIVSKGNK